MDAPPPRVKVRLRRYVRGALLVVIPLAAVVTLRIFAKETPEVAWVRSGTAKVVRVNDDASLTISQESKQRAPRSAEVHWLGIEIDSRELAQRWLEDRLDGVEELTLRLDRRRIDEFGQLRAYFFLGETLLNAELVQHGLAKDATHPSDFAAIARVIRRAEVER